MKTPSDFTNHPFDSLVQSFNAEIVACNIMKIMKKKGNKWEKLTWEKYKEERQVNFHEEEKDYFEKVVEHCVSPEKAKMFSKAWL